MQRIYTQTSKLLSRALAPLVFRAVGLNVFQYRKWLSQTMSWSPERRREWRLTRLQKMLTFCWNHVPFYREFWGDHGLSDERIASLEDLENYPILTRDTLRDNLPRIVPNNLSKIPHKRNSTGGTTGEPLTYFQDLELWSFSQAFHLWGWGQSGYRFGDPVAMLAGSSLLPQDGSVAQKLRYILERKLLLSGVHMDAATAQKHYQKLTAYGAKFLYGYPSVISEFASLVSELGLTPSGLLGVITTAEVLQPQYRTNIERIFECEVWDHYGCNDGGMLSYECRLHEGYHYNDLQCILEIGKEEPEGLGSLLITSLWNRSTPFIRYQNGDVASLGQSSCVCGQPFPLIGTLHGRTLDVLKFRDGRTLYGPALRLIFRDMEIKGFQVVQRSIDEVEVRICSSSLQQEYSEYIEKVFSHHVPDDVKVEVVRVDKLYRTPSGKLKPFWVEYHS